jgi:hypothetical protein
MVDKLQKIKIFITKTQKLKIRNPNRIPLPYDYCFPSLSQIESCQLIAGCA